MNNAGERANECENLKQQKYNPSWSEMINVFDITKRKRQMEENVLFSNLKFLLKCICIFFLIKKF